MKNSLFKRAFAAVATVPIALTQCLAVANAVDVNNTIVVSTKTAAPAENELSLDFIMSIEPTESDGNYNFEDGKYIKDAYRWRTTVNGLFDRLRAKEPTGTLDPNPVFENVINRAGKYADLAKSATEKVGTVNYSVDENNNIVITASVDDITPVIEDFAQRKVGASLKQLAEDYNMEELGNIKFFKGVEIAGDIEIVIDASDLQNVEGGIINGSITFTDKATGKVYSSTAIADYFTEKMKALQDSAKSTIADLSDKYDLTNEELENLVQESQEYKDLIQNLKEGYTPEEGEIETMILESVEFQNLVADYMADNGVDYAEAEAAVKDSDDFKDMTERFTNGINLSDAEIKEILHESKEYNELVENYMADNDVDYDSAVDAVLQSDDYNALLDSYTDKYTYTDEEISAMVKGSADYQSKMAEIKVEYDDTYSKMTAKANSAEAELDKIVRKATNAITKGLEKYEKVKTYEGSYEFANYAEMAEAVNNNELFNKAVHAAQNKAPDKIADKIPDKVPTDLGAVASNQRVQKIFSEVINQLAAKTGYTVDVTPESIADFVESCTDIKISAESGVVTFTGKLSDDEANAEAATYVDSTYNFEVSEVYKEATVILDYTNLDTAGNASVDFQLKRVVEGTPKTTTTTTTGTTTETVTTDTVTTDTVTTDTVTTDTVTTDTVTTDTVTTVDPTVSTTVDPTVSTTVDPTVSTTVDPTVSTTVDPTVSTTVDPTVSTTVDPTVSTTVDPTVSTTVDPTVSTTVDPTVSTTVDPTVSTTTSEIVVVGTTTVSAEVSVSVKVESVDAFYLTIDKEFDKEQVKSVSYEATVKYVTIDEAGNVINEETSDDVLKGDITDKFTFNDTPASIYKKDAVGIYKFIYNVPLYAAEDIVSGDVVVFKAGDVITTTDGDDATITAYIGVKGDADLDGKAIAKDASVVLAWYSKASTGNTESAFSNSELVVNEVTGEIINETLDRFAAFLADTDNENDADNCKPTKTNGERRISSKDASFILAQYSAVSTGATGGKDATRELWNEILGDYAKKED